MNYSAGTDEEDYFELLPYLRMLRAFMESPPPPCDSCNQKKRCAAKSLSCDAFAAYVVGKSAAEVGRHERIPTTVIHYRVYECPNTAHWARLRGEDNGQ